LINSKYIIKYSNILKNYLRNRYALNFLSIASSTLIAQIIAFVGSIFLARLYNSEAFGYFSIFSSTISILSIISSLRYEFAIPLPNNTFDSIRVFQAVFVISVCISFASFFVITFLLFINVIDNKQLYTFLYPILIIINSQTISLNILNNKIGTYKKTAFGKIFVSMVSFLISFTLASYFKNTGLIIGTFFGQLFLNIYLFQILPKPIKSILFSRFSKYSIRKIIIKYASLPKYNLLPATLNNIASQFPNYTLSGLFGMHYVGLFFFSQRLVMLPVSLIGTALNDVIFQKAIEKKNSKLPLRDFALKNFYFLLIFGLFFLFSIYFLTDIFIPMFFGKKWFDAILVCKILAVSSSIKLIVSPLTIIFIVLDNAKKSALWQYLYFLGFLTLVCIILLLKPTFVNTILAFSVYDLILYLYALYLLNKTILNYDNSVVV